MVVYYISKSVRAVRWVDLAVYIQLNVMLKFKAVFVAKMVRDLSLSVLNCSRE